MAAHPYKRFLKSKGLTFDEAVLELNRLGARTRQGTPLTPNYLSQLMTGYRRPSYPLAAAMARHSKDEVKVEAIMEWRPSEGTEVAAA